MGPQEGQHENLDYDAETIIKLVGPGMAKLDTLGFDVKIYFINPADTSSINTVKSMLNPQLPPYDALAIRFGLRGTKELTPL